MQAAAVNALLRWIVRPLQRGLAVAGRSAFYCAIVAVVALVVEYPCLLFVDAYFSTGMIDYLADVFLRDPPQHPIAAFQQLVLCEMLLSAGLFFSLLILMVPAATLYVTRCLFSTAFPAWPPPKAFFPEFELPRTAECSRG